MKANSILVAINNPDDALLVLRALKKNGMGGEVVVTRDGAEAFDHLLGEDDQRDIGVMPDVVLLDLRLPKIDGLELLGRVRSNERTRSLPVVVLASDERDRDVIAAHGLRVDLVIKKEVDFVRFSQELRRLRTLLDKGGLSSRQRPSHATLSERDVLSEGPQEAGLYSANAAVAETSLVADRR